ncbi:MAG: QueT transporter family protein [bacterium]
MRDLIRMWSNTRMIVLVAICAAVYAAILIPFKPIPLIPGVTELRPANAIPPIASFLFGPAAAWGIAFGNLIGDFFGTLGPVTIFGFLGNFLLGWIPYRMWRALDGTPAPPFLVGGGSTAASSPVWLQLGQYAFTIVVASAACALVIGWGGLLFQAFPVRVVAPIIFFNNVSWSLVVSPFVMRAVAPRVRAWGLTADQILADDSAAASGSLRLVGLFLTPAAALGGLLLLYFFTGSAAAGLDPRWVAAVPAVLVFAGTALL